MHSMIISFIVRNSSMEYFEDHPAVRSRKEIICVRDRQNWYQNRTYKKTLFSC